MGLNSLKIDQDTAKIVKRKILKNMCLLFLLSVPIFERVGISFGTSINKLNFLR